VSQLSIEDSQVRGSLTWWLKRPWRVLVGLWRRDPEYLARLGLLRLMGVPLPETVAPLSLTSADASSSVVSVRDLLTRSLPNLVPIVTYPDPGPTTTGRLTILTDTISSGSLFGGVGTAILFGAALARHRGLRLRVVTRHDEPEPGNFGAILAAHGAAFDENVEFECASTVADARGLAVFSGDLVLTTSWWTTWAALQSFDPACIVYLLQDDERMFYPAGDLQLRCREIFCDPRLRFVVNTSALLKHLVDAGMTGVARRGISFEPAFPLAIYYREPKSPAGKRRFFFYARPNNPRNLFLRGLEAVAGAVENNCFPEAEWELEFVGRNIPDIQLPRNVRPRISTSLSWHDYAALIRQVDVGLSLMLTPHPSYPPLDLAASGAVVVTNRYGPKQSLESYCANILCVEPSVNDLVGALGHAVALATNETRRLSNYENACINRDWDEAFAPVLTVLGEL